MLKIKKGLKKKIKGKKDKGKEDDLFDPEQLEKYRKELEEKRRAEAEQDPTGSSSTPKDEEWLKFQALTAGVDSILQQTTTDLDKIKESSFYQRKAPIIPDNWHEAHSSASGAAQANSVPGEKGDPTWTNFKGEDHESEVQESNEDKPPEEFVVPESPEEPEVLDDSLFDTSYLDAIASGEIQLAYIPDSPVEEEGDDPFDTSGVADVVKRIEEAEKQAKRQVNLGNAVDFYSGKTGQSIGNKPRPRPGDSSKKARPRPRAVNLLGDDENSVVPSSTDVQVVERPKDIFDIDEILSSPIKDVSSPLLDKIPVTYIRSAVPNIKKDSPEDDKNKFQDILGEFDEISRVDEPVKNYVSANTAALLASVLEPQPEDDEFDDEFAALATESIHKNPSPLPPSADTEEVEEEDPFDTTFVEKVAPPGKFELKNIESELLGRENSNAEKDAEDDDFDPRIGEAPVVQRNLLEDHSPSVEHPPAIEPHFAGGKPVTESLDHLEADPFDTSTVEDILPGKAELKLLEEELLKHEDKPCRPKLPNFPIVLSAPKPIIANDEDDFDFNPRKDEPREETDKTPGHLFDTIQIEDELAHKVLTPQLEPVEVELDPFDTSIASALVLVPGQLELRLLETELVESEPQQPIQRELSDPEFDPRGGEEPDPFIVSINTNLKTEDIFDLTEEITSHKVLTPQQETARSIVPESPTDYDDPFDTSSIEVLKLLPASELKQIEGELLNAVAEVLTAKPIVFRPIFSAPPGSEPPPPSKPTAPQHLFDTLDHSEDEIGHKPLTPAEIPLLYVDPFDTSIAEGVVPGKAEIKILEKELLADGGFDRDLSDPDFNPRGPQPIHPSALSFVSKTLEPTRASDQSNLSSDIDPFDTSFAVDTSAAPVSTGPGKAELKALEAELL